MPWALIGNLRGPAGSAGATGSVGPKGDPGDPGTPAASYVAVPFHSDATANVTLTNQSNTEQFLAGNNRNIRKIDLTAYTQARLVVRVVTGSASANTPRMYARYRTTFSTTTADYSALGTSDVQISLASTGIADSGWINLVSGAKADVFLTVLQHGGDGVADPAVGNVEVQFK